jgi:hypothetical protein
MTNQQANKIEIRITAAESQSVQGCVTRAGRDHKPAMGCLPCTIIYCLLRSHNRNRRLAWQAAVSVTVLSGGAQSAQLFPPKFKSGSAAAFVTGCTWLAPTNVLLHNVLQLGICLMLMLLPAYQSHGKALGKVASAVP